MTGAKGAFETLSGEVLHSDQFRQHARRRGAAGGGDMRSPLDGTLEEFMQHLDKNKEKEEGQAPTDTPPQQQLSEEHQQQEQERGQVTEAANPEDISEKSSPEPCTDHDNNSSSNDGSSCSSDGDGDANEPMEFLASVCTESGFQDFVNISRQEMKMNDSFIITEEKLDSYFMSRATIHVEEGEEDGERGRGVCVCMATLYLIHV